MKNYQLYLEGPEQVLADGVMRLPDMALIPNNPDNRDWVEYQAWLAAGNVPLPADEEVK